VFAEKATKELTARSQRYAALVLVVQPLLENGGDPAERSRASQARTAQSSHSPHDDPLEDFHQEMMTLRKW